MILATKMFLKSAKTVFFVLPGKGVYTANIDQFDQFDQTVKNRGFWSINNKNWSTFFSYIDHYIPFLICALEAVVKLVNFFRYTPPHVRKLGRIVVKFSIFGQKNLTTRLTSNEESTTYRGHFLPLFQKWVKSFVLSPALQSKGLIPFGQVFVLEK